MKRARAKHRERLESHESGIGETVDELVLGEMTVEVLVEALEHVLGHFDGLARSVAIFLAVEVVDALDDLLDLAQRESIVVVGVVHFEGEAQLLLRVGVFGERNGDEELAEINGAAAVRVEGVEELRAEHVRVFVGSELRKKLDKVLLV